VEQAPDDEGDVGRVQAGGGDLVEQRLERVEVVAVDQRDLDRCAGQAAGRGEAAEPGTDHDHVREHAHEVSLRGRL
jgi:hypothetical protein